MFPPPRLFLALTLALALSSSKSSSPWEQLNNEIFLQPHHLLSSPSPAARASLDRHLLSTSEDTNLPNPPTEVWALSALFHSLHGRGWDWSFNESDGQRWDFETSAASPCADHWQRVTCVCAPPFGYCFVVALDLSSLNLNGTISSDIKHLSQLVYLNMANNSLLGGTIPPEIGMLTNLVYLSLYISHVTGTIPNEIQSLQSLEYLVLGSIIDFNVWVEIQSERNLSISGPYPDVLASLSSLKYLYLFGTQQHGTIPSSYSTMTQLNALILGGTLLTGTIPPSIFSLTNLVYFVVGTSKMTGTIPPEIGNMPNCIVISLNSNYFTSTLPETLSRLSSLEYGLFSYNSFSGSFPRALTSMTKLRDLYLHFNRLTGTLPPEIGRLSELRYLSLASNRLSSQLPSEIGHFSALQFLDLSDNKFSGTCSSLGSLSTVELINLTHNQFSGSLSTFHFQQLSRLKTLQLSSNSFVGSLPSELSALTSLEYFHVYNNRLKGKIPSWLGQYESLISLDLSANLFTGSIPSTIASLGSLVYLDISFNSLGSTLPEAFAKLSSLQYLFAESCQLNGGLLDDFGSLQNLQNLILKKNRFTGSIPESISSLESLQLLDLSENQLSGSLPAALTKLTNLKFLLLPTNQLQGNLETLVGLPTSILTIDMSDNVFTGTVPVGIFALPSLQHFAAVVNCLHGRLHPLMCESQSLKVLALDGIGASPFCQQNYWDGNFDAYGLLHGLRGTIPNCFFEMNQLISLHMSGNLISGSISEHLNISGHLLDLSLSHNLLTGSIPLKIQQRKWVNLDLAFNKFYGSLSSKFAFYSPASSLRLRVNRLSGKVPATIRRAYNVSVLDGNLFECDIYGDGKDLPRHDSAATVYQCADSFQQLSYIWMSPYLLFLLLAFMGVCLLTAWKSLSEKAFHFAAEIDQTLAILDKRFSSERTSTILLFKKFVVDWQVTCIFIAACNIFIVLPAWVALTHYFNTYQYEYSWSASVAYLSGLIPSIIALLMFTLLLATVFSLSTTNTTRHKSRRTSMWVAIELSESFRSKLFHYGVLFIITLLNCVIVVGVNVLYVLATITFNKTVVAFCAMALATFSFVWNLVILSLFEGFEDILEKSISPDIFQRFQQRNLITLSIIGLFNSILIPLLSTAAVSSTCLYYFFMSAESISTSFEYSECLVQTVVSYTCSVVESVTVCHNFLGSTYQCLGEYPVVKTTSFSPPFHYSYQCSSTFIASYAAVYVYVYLMIALVSPLIFFLLCKLREALPAHSYGQRYVDSLLPPYLLPVDENFQIGKKLFYKDYFITSAVIDTAVLITFGAIFPPLSFVICTAIMIRAILILYQIGSMLRAAEEKCIPQYSQQLLRDCADIPEIFGKLLWLILPFSALIFSLFIFDTYGDAVSWQRALIPSGAMCLVPVFFVLLRRAYLHPSVKPYVDELFDWCRDHLPAAKIVLKSRPKDLGLSVTTIVSGSVRLTGVSNPNIPPPNFVPKLRPNPPTPQHSITKVTPLHDLSLSSRENEHRPAMKVSNDLSLEEL